MHTNLINLDLSNSNLWETEFFQFQQKSLGEADLRLPIPDFDVPLFQRSRVMAARFYNPVARPWWKLGCYLKQTVPAPGGTIANGSLEVANWRIPLYHHESSKNQKIFFPDPGPIVWQLKASVPAWHDQCELTVWRFTGDLPDPPTAYLRSLKDGQAEVEAKINEILLRLP